MSERKEGDDYLSRGLSSVIRRQRERDGAASPPRQPPPPLENGDGDQPSELAGRPVVDLIARGGVGLVYRVADRQLGRELAVKILSRRYAADPEMVQRFQAEARICAQLQHPGIVPIHEAGQLADGRPYFTMKVVEGDTLVDLLAARTDPTANRRRFLEVFEKVCQTLAFVHAQGVVHGDVKPSNVMVGAFGEVQVMDWGFARWTDPDAGRSTVAPAPPDGSPTTHILGTPAYMAPEQARGDEAAITSRTDVFGLGAILCEILTGRPPYAGETRSATYLQATQCWQDDARGALRTCDADRALVDLSLRCLSPEPAGRPVDGGAVGDEIAAYLEGLQARAYELELKAVAAEARADQVGRSRRVLVAMGSLLLVAVVAIAGVLLWLQHDRGNREAETHRLLAQVIGRARAAFERAREQPPGEILHWDEAQAAARQAQQLATTRAASAGEREPVSRLVAEIEREASSAQQVHAQLEWIEQMRPHYSDERQGGGLGQGYREGFARFGFDFSTPAADLASRIQASPIAGAICGAVDDWARVARHLRAARPDWRDLVAVARRADPQPFRDQLRVAFLADDRAALRQLAASGELAAAAPETVNLLAKCLFDLGAVDEAVRVLRTALARHPDDYWILHDLAVFLRRQPSPPVEEILGLGRAAVAVRPRDPHALADLAHSLAFLHGRWGEAGVLLGRALDVEPTYTRGWFPEVLVLTGQRDRGLQVARRAAERAPMDASAHRVLGWTAHIQGHLAEAATAFRTACRLAPEDVEPRSELASVLVTTGELAEARQVAADVRRLGDRVGASGWSLAEEYSLRAIERSGEPATLDGREGWPDASRAMARFYVGRVEDAAEELEAWLRRGPEANSLALIGVGLQAALQAAQRAGDPVARRRWQAAALEFLAAGVASCNPATTTGGSARLALTQLRWLQWDPLLRDTVWSEDAREEATRLEAAMARMVADLLDP